MSTNPPPPKGGVTLNEQQYHRLLKLADEGAVATDVKVANRNCAQIGTMIRTVARGEYSD